MDKRKIAVSLKRIRNWLSYSKEIIAGGIGGFRYLDRFYRWLRPYPSLNGHGWIVRTFRRSTIYHHRIWGAFFSVMIRYPLDIFLGMFSAMMKIISQPATKPQDIIEVAVECANTARKGSILAFRKKFRLSMSFSLKQFDF